MDWLGGGDPWLPKVILGATIVFIAIALAGLFLGSGHMPLRGVEQSHAQLDS